MTDVPILPFLYIANATHLSLDLKKMQILLDIYYSKNKKDSNNINY